MIFELPENLHDYMSQKVDISTPTSLSRTNSSHLDKMNDQLAANETRRSFVPPPFRRFYSSPQLVAPISKTTSPKSVTPPAGDLKRKDSESSIKYATMPRMSIPAVVARRMNLIHSLSSLNLNPA